MMKAGMSLVGAAVLATGLAISGAQAAEMSEQAVRSYMGYAWAMTPAQFTKPDGVKILIDKKKREAVEVPVDVAREVILAAYRTARAQMCEMNQEGIDNHNSLMLREVQKKKWSDQQIVYINMLHLTVVQLMTSKVKIVEKDGDKVVVEEELQSKAVKPCADDERVRLKEQIAAYVKTGPALASAEPAPAAAPAATPAAAQKAPAAPPKK